MRVLTARGDVAAALGDVRAALEAALDDVGPIHWSFPGHGSTSGGVPTWSRAGESGLAVGVGDDGDWSNRTPILIATRPAYPRICPVVEVNIPHTNGEANRSINGCFGRAQQGAFWLLHRGNGFTAKGGRITKMETHAAFASDLIDVTDAGRLVPVIPVARLDAEDFVEQLRRFAQRVEALKNGDDGG